VWADFAETETTEIIRHDGEPLYQLSASSISTLLTCPEKFRISYLHGIWPKSSGATVLGNAYHHARQVNYEQKVFSGADLPPQAIGAAYDEGWQNAVSDEIQWRDSDPLELWALGKRMALQYHEKISPSVVPVAVEERFKLEIPGVGVPVVGRIDVRDATTMIDTKTQDKGAKKPEPGWRPQAFLYCAARPGYDFEWHVHAKSGQTVIWTPRMKDAKGLRFANTSARRHAAEQIARHAWGLLVHLYDSYGIQQPWPAHGLVHGFACKWCSYKGRCWGWV